MQFDRSAKSWTELTDFGNVTGRITLGAACTRDGNMSFTSENSNGQIWSFPLSSVGTQPILIATGLSATSNDGARYLAAVES
ncbi:hypothetical protein F5B20DRAFT_546501 [Whalleya microplaca]|nr:hypothetical protein F5B20DRAFT_546501 [Whalleya microplaca]